MISLLNYDEAETGKTGERVLYHLLIDRITDFFCRNQSQRELFSDIISAPLTDGGAVMNRQDVLKDFLDSPELLDGMCGLFDKFSELKKAHNNARKDDWRFSRDSDFGADFVIAKNLLSINALTLKKLFILMKSISGFMSGFYFTSKPLKELKASLDRVCQAEEYEALLEICTKFEMYSTSSTLDFTAELDETGRICKCELIPHGNVRISEPTLKKKRRFFRGDDEPTYPCQSFFVGRSTSVSTILSAPLKNLSEVFSSISSQIISLYSGIFKECCFYKAALDYCRKLKEKGCQYVFPSVSDSGDTSIHGLRDIYLTLRAESPDDVIPNDFNMLSKQNGIVVFGKNGGGKTVYLRSVGTAQLFSQAGLPIPAEKAEICCFNTVLTQFSESEKDFKEGSDAGRFEQEVSEISAIMDELSQNTLVLLNETFQTTAYDEGAEGLADILNYFSSLKSKWILVSHIHQIKDFLPDTTLFRTFKDNYTIE